MKMEYDWHVEYPKASQGAKSKCLSMNAGLLAFQSFLNLRRNTNNKTIL